MDYKVKNLNHLPPKRNYLYKDFKFTDGRIITNQYHSYYTDRYASSMSGRNTWHTNLNAQIYTKDSINYKITPIDQNITLFGCSVWYGIMDKKMFKLSKPWNIPAGAKIHCQNIKVGHNFKLISHGSYWGFHTRIVGLGFEEQDPEPDKVYFVWSWDDETNKSGAFFRGMVTPNPESSEILVQDLSNPNIVYATTTVPLTVNYLTVLSYCYARYLGGGIFELYIEQWDKNTAIWYEL